MNPHGKSLWRKEMACSLWESAGREGMCREFRAVRAPLWSSRGQLMSGEEPPGGGGGESAGRVWTTGREGD